MWVLGFELEAFGIASTLYHISLSLSLSQKPWYQMYHVCSRVFHVLLQPPDHLAGQLVPTHSGLNYVLGMPWVQASGYSPHPL